MIDDDVYNRIIEFKAKKEIIKMNMNYSNVDKIIWTDKYVHEHHAYDKNKAGYVNVGSFQSIRSTDFEFPEKGLKTFVFSLKVMT